MPREYEEHKILIAGFLKSEYISPKNICAYIMSLSIWLAVFGDIGPIYT